MHVHATSERVRRAARDMAVIVERIVSLHTRDAGLSCGCLLEVSFDIEGISVKRQSCRHRISQKRNVSRQTLDTVGMLCDITIIIVFDSHTSVDGCYIWDESTDDEGEIVIDVTHDGSSQVSNKLAGVIVHELTHARQRLVSDTITQTDGLVEHVDDPSEIEARVEEVRMIAGSDDYATFRSELENYIDDYVMRNKVPSRTRNSMKVRMVDSHMRLFVERYGKR